MGSIEPHPGIIPVCVLAGFLGSIGLVVLPGNVAGVGSWSCIEKASRDFEDNGGRMFAGRLKMKALALGFKD